MRRHTVVSVTDWADVVAAASHVTVRERPTPRPRAQRPAPARVKVADVLIGSSRVNMRADWRDQSGCVGAHAIMLDDRHETAAKMICADCPVIAECRADALTHREPAGVRGGMAPLERAELVDRRRKAHRRLAS